MQLSHDMMQSQSSCKQEMLPQHLFRPKERRLLL